LNYSDSLLIHGGNKGSIPVLDAIIDTADPILFRFLPRADTGDGPFIRLTRASNITGWPQARNLHQKYGGEKS
jgi:hypothetical protein